LSEVDEDEDTSDDIKGKDVSVTEKETRLDD
jgi:hypothetical protein